MCGRQTHKTWRWQGGEGKQIPEHPPEHERGKKGSSPRGGHPEGGAGCGGNREEFQFDQSELSYLRGSQIEMRGKGVVSGGQPGWKERFGVVRTRCRGSGEGSERKGGPRLDDTSTQQ